jgi:hypothetical protein
MPAFLKTYGLKGVHFVADGERLAPLFGTVYQSLPLPVRMLVKQETFVRFCLSQKENLLGKWPEAHTPAATGLPAEPAEGKAKRTPATAKPTGARKGSAGKEAAPATPAKETRTKKKPVS